jgi:S1-C subfamily serine protease
LAQTFGARSTEGVIITGVLQNGPAAKAGVKPGDVIESINERKIKEVTQLLSVVASLKPGTAAHFTIERKSQKLELNVTPGVRPKPKAAAR